MPTRRKGKPVRLPHQYDDTKWQPDRLIKVSGEGHAIFKIRYVWEPDGSICAVRVYKNGNPHPDNSIRSFDPKKARLYA